jgi:hypothetical protein
MSVITELGSFGGYFPIAGDWLAIVIWALSLDLERTAHR